MAKIFTVDDFNKVGIDTTKLDKLNNLSSPNNLDKTAKANTALSSGIMGGYNTPEALSIGLKDNGFWENELRAYNQSTLDKWANGVTKFAGNTGLYTIGNLAGLVYGIPSAIANGELRKFYDNAFMHMLDNASESLDEALPNYVSREEADYVLMRSMGTANFWANDVMGGMAFTASAVLSEVIASSITAATFGAGSPIQAGMTARLLSQASRQMKNLNKASRVSDALQSANTIAKINKIGDYASKSLGFGRQMIMGAGYEAGVEARHFIDEAKQNYIQQYIAANGVEPTEAEIAEKMDPIHKTANTLFAGNLILVGGGNMFTLPKTFGRGISNLPVKTSKLSQLLNPKGLIKEGSDEWATAYSKWSKARKVGYAAQQVVKRPLYEGFVEEGMQGLMNRASLDYMAKKYSPEGAIESYSMWDALNTAFHETYGGGDKAFWKEVMIGVIIGGLGSPTFKSSKVFGEGWQGSFLGSYRSAMKDINAAEEYVDFLNKNKVAPNLYSAIKAFNSQYEDNKGLDDAISQGDIFTAKTKENAQLFTSVYERYKLGKVADIHSDILSQISNMSAEEFSTTFGYDNLTDEEVEERKKEVLENTTNSINAIIGSIEAAKKIVRDKNLISNETGDILENDDLVNALAYNIATSKNLDFRENELESKLKESLNLNTLNYREFLSYNKSKEWIDKFKVDLDELNKLKAKQERYLKMSSKKETIKKHTDAISETEKEIEALSKKIAYKESRLNDKIDEIAQRPSEFEYDRNPDNIEANIKSYLKVQEEIKRSRSINPETSEELKTISDDLHKIALQRNNFVKELQSLMSREGAKAFSDDLNEIKKDAFRITKKELIDRYKGELRLIALEQLAKGQAATQEERDVQEGVVNEKFEEESDGEYMPDNVEGTPKYELRKASFDDMKETFLNEPKNLKNTQSYIKKLQQLIKLIEEDLAEDNLSDEAQQAYLAIIDNIVKQSKAASELAESFNNIKNVQSKILENVKGFIRVIVEEERAEEVLNTLSSIEDVNASLNIRKIKYDKSGTKTYPKDINGQDLTGPVEIMSGDGKGNGYMLYYGDFLIGGITHPNKFLYMGRPLDINNDAEIAAVVGTNKVDIEKFKIYHKKATILFDKVDKGTVTLEDIREVIKLEVGSPGFRPVAASEGRINVSDFVLANPSYHVTIGKNKGLLVWEDGNDIVHMVLPSGEIIPQDNEEARAYVDKAGRRMLENKMHHQYAALIPAGSKVIALGLDYPPSQSIESNEFESQLKSSMAELNAMSHEQLLREHKDKGAVVRESDLFVTASSTKYPTPRINITIRTERKYIEPKDGSAPYFSTARVAIKVNSLDDKKSMVFIDGLVAEKDGVFTIKYKDYGKEKEIEFSTENFVLGLNKKLHARAFAMKDKGWPVIDAVLDDSNEVITFIKDVKNRLSSKEIGTFELASLPRNTKPEERIRLTSNNKMFTELEKETEKSNVKDQPTKENPKVSKPKGTTSKNAVTPGGVVKTEEKTLTREEFLESIIKGLNEGKSLNQIAAVQDVLKAGVEVAVDESGDYTLIIPEFGNTKETRINLDGELKIKPVDFNDDNLIPDVSDEEPDDPMFSSNRYDGTGEVTISQAIGMLAEILPLKTEDNPNGIISIEELNKIVNNLYNNGEAFGAFYDSVIYLHKNKATKGVVYHEAFHAVFRTILSPTERQKVLLEAINKFGEPTEDQLKDLARAVSPYKYLSVQELTDIWLEEKLADEFTSYAVKETEPKTWIGKLFRRISKWIDSLLNKDKFAFEYLFDDILSGQFKSVSNHYSNTSPIAFALLRTKVRQVPESDSNIRMSPRSKLTRKESETLISRVANKILEYKDNSEEFRYTIGHIERAISEVAQYYSIDNWMDEVNYLKKYGENKYDYVRLVDKVVDMSNAITHKQNVDVIRTEVVKILNAVDPDISFSSDEQDTPERAFDKHIGEDTGFSTLTERIKALFLTTVYSGDEFNIGLTEEDLEDSKYYVPINVFDTYYTVQKGLVNTLPSRMLAKLEYLAELDNSTKAFLMHLKVKFSNELNVPIEKLSDLNIAQFRKSPTFNAFVSSFYRTRSRLVDTLYDSSSGRFLQTNANTKDAAKTQFEQWANDFSTVNPASYFDIADGINALRSRYNPNSDSEEDMLEYINTLDTRVREVQKFLKDRLKMPLHPAYIKWSMVKDNLKAINKYILSVEEEIDATGEHNSMLDTLDELMEVQELFKDARLNSLNEQIKSKDTGKVTGLLFGLLPSKKLLSNDRSDGNPYTSKGAIVNNVGGERFKTSISGAVTRLLNVAASNAIIDPSIRPTSYQNIEGKNIWDITYHSFYTEIYEMFKTESFLTYFKGVKSGVSTWTDLKMALRDNELSYPDHFIKLYHNSIVNNPIVTSSDIDVLFSNMSNMNIIGGMRETAIANNYTISDNAEFKEGKTWKHLDPKAKLLLRLINFANSRNIDGTDVVDYIFNINSDKSTAYTVPLAKIKTIDPNSDGLSTQALYQIHSLFMQEFNRIKFEVNNEDRVGKDISKYEGYNTEDGRAYDFMNFKFLRNYEDIYNDVLKLAKDQNYSDFDTLLAILTPVYNDYFNNITNEYLEILQSPAVRAISKDDKGRLVNSSLPEAFLIKDTKNKEVNIRIIKDFIINGYIASASFNNLLFGDMAFQNKNFTDMVQRNAGAVAYGPSLGEGTTRISILKGYEDPRVSSKVDPADAQSYMTEAWFYNTYLSKQGKLFSSNVAKVWKKKRKGLKLSDRDIKTLKAAKAMGQSRKLVLFDHIIYGKTSTALLDRESTSYVLDKDRRDLNLLYDELFKAEEEGKDTNPIYEKIHKYWKPLPNRKELHDKLNEAELNGGGLIFFDSAVKKAKPNVTDINSPMNYSTVNNKFIREQMVTDGFKYNIVHGTQLLQLIWSEQSSDTEVTIDGINYNLGSLRNAYQKLLSERIKNGESRLISEIFEEKDGKLIPKEDKLGRIFMNTLETTNPNPYLMELFSTDVNGNFNYNPNFPGVSTKFYQMFLSFASKDVLKHKTRGVKYTLQSDYGYKIIEKNGKIIRTKDFSPELGITEEDTRPLNYDNETGEAECIISSNVANLYKLKPGDEIPEALAKQLGFRIPTQDKHSMIKLKVVDLLPATTMNTIIVHPKVIELSGADFDVDSLYARLYDTYKGYIKFGEYVKTGNISHAVEDVRNSSEYKDKFKEYLKGAKIASKQSILSKMEGTFSLEDLQEELNNKEKDELAMVKMAFFDLHNLQTEPEVLRKTNPELYHKIVKNINNYKKSGISEVEPLTLEEYNNRLLDIEYEFVRNQGNKEIAETPVSFDILDKALDRWREIGVDYNKESIGTHDEVSVYNSIRANDAGNAGIGPAALDNVILQNLISQKTKFTEREGVEFTILGKSEFSEFGKGEDRVNNAATTYISAMTDNTKHLYSYKFNLNKDTISVAFILAGLGIDSMTALTLMRQKSFSIYSDLMERKSSPINSAGELRYINSALTKLNYLKYIVASSIDPDIELDEDGRIEGYEGDIEININNLLEGLKYENGLESTLSKEEYITLQLKVAQEAFKAKKLSEEFFNYSRVLSLIKGFSDNPTNLDTISITLDNLGLKLTSKNNKLELAKTPNADTIIDWKTVIEGNPYTLQQLYTANNIKKYLGKFLIAYSDIGQEMIKSVMYNGNRSRFNNEKIMMSVIRDVTSYLLLHSEGRKYSVKSLFDQSLHAKYNELFDRTKSPSDILYKNAFIRSIVPDTKVRLSGLITYELSANTRNKLSDDLLSEIMDSFYILAVNEPEFVKSIMQLLIVRDGLQYKNKSFIGQIDPRVLKSDRFFGDMFESLRKIQSSVNNNDEEEFSKVMGKTLSDSKLGFIQNFLLAADTKVAKVVFSDFLYKYARPMAENVYRKVMKSEPTGEIERKHYPFYTEKSDGKTSKITISLRAGINPSNFRDNKNLDAETNERNRKNEISYMKDLASELSDNTFVSSGTIVLPSGKRGVGLKFPAIVKIVDEIEDPKTGNSYLTYTSMRLVSVNKSLFHSILDDKVGEAPEIDRGNNMASGLEAVYERIEDIDTSLYSTTALDLDTLLSDMRDLKADIQQENIINTTRRTLELDENVEVTPELIQKALGVISDKLDQAKNAHVSAEESEDEGYGPENLPNIEDENNENCDE